MYDFYKKYAQMSGKKNPGRNKCNILVIHHSGSSTFQSFYNTWKNPKNVGSYQFVIDELWRSYKFWEPDDNCHHAWLSWWWPKHPNDYKNSINNISIGVCIIWPLKDWNFNDSQRQEAIKLTQYITSMYKIWKENLVRHIDITQYNKNQIRNKIYRTVWSGMCRKADINPYTRDRQKFIDEVYAK